VCVGKRVLRRDHLRQERQVVATGETIVDIDGYDKRAALAPVNKNAAIFVQRLQPNCLQKGNEALIPGPTCLLEAVKAFDEPTRLARLETLWFGHPDFFFQCPIQESRFNIEVNDLKIELGYQAE
jgi:hypothetical protein